MSSNVEIGTTWDLSPRQPVIWDVMAIKKLSSVPKPPLQQQARPTYWTALPLSVLYNWSSLELFSVNVSLCKSRYFTVKCFLETISSISCCCHRPIAISLSDPPLRLGELPNMIWEKNRILSQPGRGGLCQNSKKHKLLWNFSTVR